MSTALSCQACGKPCSLNSPCCPGCDVVYCCSPEHLRLHRKHAHGQEECTRMAQQLQRGQLLADHQMPWPLQSIEQVEAWLQKSIGSHRGSHGLLQRCWEMHASNSHSMQAQQQGPLSPAAQSPSTARQHEHCSPVQVQHAWLPASPEEWQQAWGLPGPGVAPAWLTSPQASLQLQPPAGWRQYYDARGLAHSSPAALVLHHVLTLWHCLVNVLPSHGWPLPPTGSTIRVAYLGPQAELALLPAFAELGMLLPLHQLDIHFVGPDVLEQLHGQACRVQLGSQPHGVQQQQQQQQQQEAPTGVLQVSCWASCWHDALADWSHERSANHPPPGCEQPPTSCSAQWRPASAPAAGSFHLVFAPNAGLPAYASWVPTLQALAHMALVRPAVHQQSEGSSSSSTPGHKPGEAVAAVDACAAAAEGSCPGSVTAGAGGVPVLFSDYCEEAVVMSSQLLQHLLGRRLGLQCCINPFRDPVPATAHGTRLPACSNGFLFGFL